VSGKVDVLEVRRKEGQTLKAKLQVGEAGCFDLFSLVLRTSIPARQAPVLTRLLPVIRKEITYLCESSLSLIYSNQQRLSP
jgi:hypothetical protein